MTLETDVIGLVSRINNVGQDAPGILDRELKAIAAYVASRPMIAEAHMMLAACEQETAAREAKAARASAEHTEAEAALKAAEAAAEAARHLPDAMTQAGMWRTEEKQGELETAKGEAQRLHRLADIAQNDLSSAQRTAKSLRVSLRALEAIEKPETPCLDMILSYAGGK